MPARVVTCIESSILHVRAKKTLDICSKRCLHSAFWHHSATEILPLWWDAMTTSFMKSSQRQYKHGKEALDVCWRGDAGLLDFLYPPRTLALLRRLSTDRLDRFSQKEIFLNKRLYSSKPKRLRRKGSTLKPLAISENGEHVKAVEPTRIDLGTFNELDWTLDYVSKQSSRQYDMSSLEELDIKLRHIPSKSDNSRWDDVWDIYSSLDSAQQDTNLAVRLLVFLSFSSRNVDNERLMKLLERTSLPPAFDFWKAVLISSCTGQMQQAMKFHQMSLIHKSEVTATSGLILAHLVYSHNWQDAYNVFHEYINIAPSFTQKQEAQSYLLELWNTVTTLPELTTDTINFIEESDAHKLGLNSGFANQIISAALAHCSDPRQLDRLIPLLRFYGLETPATYPPAFKRIILHFQDFGKFTTTTEPLILQSLWSAYRIYCRPGQLETSLIQKLLGVIVTRPSSNTSESQRRALVVDILSVCAEEKIPLPYPTLVRLMDMYARLGNLDLVRLIESHLSPVLGDLQNMPRSKTEIELDAVRMRSLLTVHRARGQNDAVEAEFQTILSQYPRAKRFKVLWDQLVLTYAKAQDFKKAFDTVLVRMPEAGVIPKRTAFDYLVSICGWSGEPSTILALFEIADKHNVEVDEWMIRRLILAYIRSQEGAIAEEFVEVLSSYNVNSDNWSTRALANLFGDILIVVARRKDLRSANKIYNEMVQRKLPLTAWTYEALVLLLANLGETDQAAFMIFNVMPEHGIYAEASHLSALSKGYSIERRYADVFLVVEEIQNRGMILDTRVRKEHLNAFARLQRTDPTSDSEVILLLESYLNNSADVAWIRDDHHIWFDHYTDPYFTVLIDAYCDINATQMVETITRMLWQFREREGLSTDFPLGILRALMKVAAASGQHILVEKYWLRCMDKLNDWNQQQAFALLDLSHMDEASDRPETVTWDFRSVEKHDRSLWAPFEPPAEKSNLEHTATDSRLPQAPLSSVAHLLERPLLIYLESLAAQYKYSDIIKTVNDLQVQGYKIQSRSWNKYVTVLLQSGDPQDILAAFRATEVHLAPNMIPFLPRTADLQQRKAMLKRQMRAQQANFQLYLDPVTRRHLKEIHTATMNVTVPGVAVGLQTQSPVNLATILDSVAPNTTNSLKEWTEPRTTERKLQSEHTKIANHDAIRRRENEKLSKTTDEEFDLLDKQSPVNHSNSKMESADDVHQPKQSAWRWPHEAPSVAAINLLQQTETFKFDRKVNTAETLRAAQVLSLAFKKSTSDQPLNASQMIGELRQTVYEKKKTSEASPLFDRARRKQDSPELAALFGALRVGKSNSTSDRKFEQGKHDSKQSLFSRA